MHITCPGCATRYSLPPHLFGPAGARVCCPACWLTFVLGPEAEVTDVLGRAETEPAAPHVETNGTTAASTVPPVSHASGQRSALEIVRALDTPPGTLAAAASAGRLFAEHGSALLDAFEAFARERPVEDVAGEFRDALASVSGVELANVGAPSRGE